MDITAPLGGFSFAQLYPPNGSQTKGIVPSSTVVDGSIQTVAVGKGNMVGTVIALIVFLVFMRVIYEVAS